jgi:hypothetical protein
MNETDDTPDARYARADLAARWFLRSGMREPTPDPRRDLDEPEPVIDFAP